MIIRQKQKKKKKKYLLLVENENIDTVVHEFDKFSEEYFGYSLTKIYTV